MYQTLVRAKDNDPLSLEEMQQRLPSIFAPQPHASRSDRYVYIDTRDVIGALVAEDFRPVEARVSWPRDEERRGFAKHLVRFRKAGGVPGVLVIVASRSSCGMHTTALLPTT